MTPWPWSQKKDNEKPERSKQSIDVNEKIKAKRGETLEKINNMIKIYFGSYIIAQCLIIWPRLILFLAVSSTNVFLVNSDRL